MTKRFCDRCGSQHSPKEVVFDVETEPDTYEKFAEPQDLCGRCRNALRVVLRRFMNDMPILRNASVKA